MREVVIISPEKIFIPEDIKEFIKETPVIEDFPEIDLKITRFSGKKRESKEGSEARIDKIPGSEADRDQRIRRRDGRYIEDKTEVEAFSSEFTPGFRLNWPSRFKSDSPEDYKLNLSLNLGKTKDKFDESEKGDSKKDISLKKNFYSDFLDISSSQTTSSSGRHATRPRVQKAKASFRVVGYDITPWAEEAVNKIQRNWIIEAQVMRAKGLVGISVIIEKNGELSSIRMLNSSDVQALDEAALRAIRLSSPFPQLPDDFPSKNLEAYFEFHYND